VALAGDVYLQALRDVPVLFLVQRGSQGVRQLRHDPRIAMAEWDGWLLIRGSPWAVAAPTR
jgi:hypothetical protein